VTHIDSSYITECYITNGVIFLYLYIYSERNNKNKNKCDSKINSKKVSIDVLQIQVILLTCEIELKSV